MYLCIHLYAHVSIGYIDHLLITGSKKKGSYMNNIILPKILPTVELPVVSITS